MKQRGYKLRWRDTWLFTIGVSSQGAGGETQSNRHPLAFRQWHKDRRYSTE
jgi:hypothetical protein